MATELRKVGATVTEGPDFIHHTAGKADRQCAIDTYDDHRMAMCFSLVSSAVCRSASTNRSASVRLSRAISKNSVRLLSRQPALAELN
jgi:5-enolpyruvylshikimate-3-phosphate synthase